MGKGLASAFASVGASAQGAVPTPDTAQTLPPAVLRALHDQSHWLGSWWTVAALGVLAAGLASAAVLRWRGGGRAWPTAIAATGALALVAMAGINAYAGYVPSVAAAQVVLAGHGIGGLGSQSVGTARTGALHAVHVPVPAALHMPDATTWVYTPPGYDPASTRYPVVYLIHGEPGTSSDWVAGGDAAHTMDVLTDAGLVPPMILVSPDVNGVTETDTECLDSTRGGPQVETYLLDVLVPWVDDHLATIPDPEHRILGGMSAGAYCAVDQGLRHQDVFSTILAIMPYVNPGEGGRDMLSTSAELAAHDVASYLPDLTLPRPVPVFVDVPGDDRQSEEAAQAATLVRLLAARGEPLEYRAEPHQHHTWTMARTALPYALAFAARHL
ncbi:alpha/beta hydrolase-fold protein [Isoptericola sp. b490]|uniref:alpha/beta hydrolase n=1 Tax=Actinotalea lenta TaxID=3064654 RepID=UPI002712C171|nr:alpha/beta hydrolase-fold protein [Isoptericola sp. b490]MDO8121769.1 alpha/beta hydrolase-fold protein [Isoptericola sp. b490]